MKRFLTDKILGILDNFGIFIRKKSDMYPVMDSDAQFIEIYHKAKSFTMTSKERAYSLYSSINYIVHNSIPGDFVECGVWRGGSAMIMAATLKALGDTERNIYLYDTFKGMPEPAEEDGRFSVISSDTRALWLKHKRKNYNRLCYAPLGEVESNMEKTGYPMNKFIFVEGLVEETLERVIPDRISLLRLDTDWYSSTLSELEHLYPLLVKEGILILDDYGIWKGAKKAVDEYFLNKRIFLSRIDADGRIAIKTSSL